MIRFVHLKSLGIADPTGRPVTPQTPFILNSISKSFAALAVMQIGIPQALYPLSVMRINIPDFGYTVLVSGALALSWSVVWTGLILTLAATGKRHVVVTALPRPLKA